MPIEDVKQKIMQGRGSSNINLGIFVCSFEVCPPLMFAFDVCPLLTMELQIKVFCLILNSTYFRTQRGH